MSHAQADAGQALAVRRMAFPVEHLICWPRPFILALHDHGQCALFRDLTASTGLFVRPEVIDPTARDDTEYSPTAPTATV